MTSAKASEDLWFQQPREKRASRFASIPMLWIGFARKSTMREAATIERSSTKHSSREPLEKTLRRVTREELKRAV